MPVVKVPIVHKFGIISHSHRLELQKRLLEKQSVESQTGNKFTATRNPLGVTENFIQEFNTTKDQTVKRKLEDSARKMLDRVKRRAGLNGGGKGGHVDLPFAWTELTQLSQCKGIIQEECLDSLIMSLNQADLDPQHIPALFYLGESCLYYLRTDAASEPFLKSSELKVLKMGFLVFTRLFYHHMASQLKNYADFKGRLFTYVNGFSDCQETYAPYPNALLCVRYINEVGKIVIGRSVVEAEESKVDGTQAYNNTNETIDYNVPDELDDRAVSATTAGLSSSVHDLSPTLWHALDVWRCVAHLGGGLSDALRALNQCGMGLASESWIDAICALTVLSEASKADPRALRTLMALAQGSPPRISPTPQTPRTIEQSEYQTTVTTRAEDTQTLTTAKTALSDIDERTEENVSPDSRRLEDFDEEQSSRADNVEEVEVEEESQERSLSVRPDPYHIKLAATPEKPESAPTKEWIEKPKSGTQKKVRIDEERIEYKAEETVIETPPEDVKSEEKDGEAAAAPNPDPAPGTAWQAEVGSDWGNDRASDAATVKTFGNEAIPDTAGIHGWRWEIAVHYVQVLADVCLRGCTSGIQKFALIGNNRNLDMIHRKYLQPAISSSREVALESAGLLDMLYFRAVGEDTGHSSIDWSWRVRYQAVMGLSRLCRELEGDPIRSGVRTAAWNALLKAHSIERDTRVLEAYRLVQLEEGQTSKVITASPIKSANDANSVGSHLAAKLASLYLPPLPPPVESRQSPRPRQRTAKKLQPPPLPRTQNRTTLQEEIILATALYEKPQTYYKRQDFDLRRIVEDQWRKELHEMQEHEESGRVAALHETRDRSEQYERQKQFNRDAKFQSKK